MKNRAFLTVLFFVFTGAIIVAGVYPRHAVRVESENIAKIAFELSTQYFECCSDANDQKTIEKGQQLLKRLQAVLERGLLIDPDRKGFWTQMLQVYFRTGQLNAAIALLEKYRDHFGMSPVFHLVQCQLQEYLEFPVNTYMECYQKTVEEFKSGAGAIMGEKDYANLAIAEMLAGHVGDARKSFAKADEIWGENVVFDWEGLIHRYESAGRKTFLKEMITAFGAPTHLK